MKLTREGIQEDHIAPGYSWWVHVLCLFGTAIAAATVAVMQLEKLSLTHWLVLVGTVLMANAGEYGLHRGPFHVKKQDPSGVMFHQHTVMHHAMFDHRTMPCDSPRDFKWVLLPHWGFAAVLILVSPLVYGLEQLGAGLGWMYVLALCFYYVVYEILHTLAHLPKQLSWATHPVVLAVTRHHRVHHDPALMQRYNFNFALPLFDWIFGTRHDGRASGAVAAKTAANANPTQEGPRTK